MLDITTRVVISFLRMSKKIKLEAPTVAVALRQWRKAKGWTRKQAAEFLGVNVRTLESWEYGYRKPPAMNLVEKLWAQKRRGRHAGALD